MAKMEQVNIHEAKTNFSKLLTRVSMGEEIIIANRGVAIAKLVPLEQPTNDRSLTMGIDRGKVVISEDFDTPVDEIIAAFYGD